jgi:glycerol-3-phosphate acyltransferase PlsX
MPVVAVDAMGGDFAPEAIVRGVAQASLTTTIECVLVGDERRIQAILDTISYNPAHIAIHHASETIGMGESPKDALKTKRDASIAVGASLVASGRAHALVSAGNTGACILACAREFDMIEGIHKTALASVFPRQIEYPGQDQLALILDVGATVRCEAIDLVQFAVMGSTYARRVSKVARPRVGLLNVGIEEFKGGDVLVEAHRRLKNLSGIDFVGNIEGDDVAKGRADVIVCEGLLGNVVLKLIEGIAEVVTGIASNAIKQRRVWQLGMKLVSRDIREIARLTDYAKYGGAPLLGFQSVFIKAHGRSSAQAIENAVKVAAKAVRDGVPQEIATGIKAIT